MKRHGYSLLEVLACIVLLAALFPAASKAWVSITRLHAAQDAALDAVLIFQSLERDFRNAALQAARIVPQAGAFKTEGRSIVLTVGEGYTVFTCDDAQQPYRVELTPSGDGWIQATTRYAIPGYRCRFSPQPANTGIDFFAQPIVDRNRQGHKNAVVHFLAKVMGATP